MKINQEKKTKIEVENTEQEAKKDEQLTSALFKMSMADVKGYIDDNVVADDSVKSILKKLAKAVKSLK